MLSKRINASGTLTSATRSKKGQVPIRHEDAEGFNQYEHNRKANGRSLVDSNNICSRDRQIRQREQKVR